MSRKPIDILLVDDNPRDVRLLQEYLLESKTEKFVLSHQETLKETLLYLGKNRCDVILLDLSLPDSHGLDTLLQIHQLYSRIPIIVLTGLDDNELALEALRLGAQDYLVKGQIDPHFLARSIRCSIERKRMQTTGRPGAQTGEIPDHR